jgi:hypothetical protein
VRTDQSFRRSVILTAVLTLVGFLTPGAWTHNNVPRTTITPAGAAEVAPAGNYPQHILIIRPGEKPEENGDEHLSSRGAARAAALPSLFFIPKSAFQTKPAPFSTPDCIYATRASKNSNRPVETVQPLAKALGDMETHAKQADPDYQPVVDHLFNEQHAGKTVAAPPPMRINRTPWPTSNGKIPGKLAPMLLSLGGGAPGGAAQLLRVFQKGREFPKALLDRQFQVLAQQRAVDVLLVRLDHRIIEIRGRQRIANRLRFAAEFGHGCSPGGE